ncbi:MAG: hypothetical protein AAF515_05595 [Pseudomonadota bacterium]
MGQSIALSDGVGDVSDSRRMRMKGRECPSDVGLINAELLSECPGGVCSIECARRLWVGAC